MTKINSSTSKPIESEAAVDADRCVEQGASGDAEVKAQNTQQPVRDTVVEDEEGFFESLGKEAGKFVDEAVDTAGEALETLEEAHKKHDMHRPVLSDPTGQDVDLEKVRQESGIGVPLQATEEEIAAFKEGVDFVRDLAGMAETIGRKMSEHEVISKTIDAMEKGTHLDEKLEFAEAGLELISTAGDAYERFVEAGRNPMQEVRNVQAAVERVEENVNASMKEAFGEDALQITLNPSLEDLAYTAAGLLDDQSKVSRQIKTAWALGGVEVARENAQVMEAIADSKVARAVSEAVEEKADVLGALGAVGAGMLLRPVGVLGGFAVAGAILTDTIDMPIPTAQTLDDFATGLQENPERYRDLAVMITGPSPHQLESLEVGGELHSEYSIDAEVGKGVKGAGSLGASISSRKVSEDAHLVTVELRGETAAKIGEKLSGVGLNVTGSSDKKVRVSMLISGRESHEAVSALHRGDVVNALLTGASADAEGLEIESGTGISATAGFFDAELSRNFELGIDDEKVSISSEVNLGVGAELSNPIAKLPNPNDSQGVKDFVGAWTELTKLEESTHTSADLSFSARAAIEREHDSATSLVIELGVAASREDFELEGKLEVRITDVRAMIESTGMTAEELVTLAETEPERLLEFITDKDIEGVDVDAAVQCRDVEPMSASFSPVDTMSGSVSRLKASAWRDIESGSAAATRFGGFSDPRQYRM